MAIRGKEVLIIDDAADARFLAKRILESAGMTVLEADSVEQAMQVILTRTPHLVIVDLQMPVRSGFSFLEERASHYSLVAVPVIVVSGLRDKQSVYRAIGLGASDYVVKPFSTSILLQKIRKLLKDADFKSRRYSKKEGPPVTLSVAATISNVHETGFFLQSPIKIERQTSVKLESPVLTDIGLGDAVFLTQASPGVRGASGFFFSRVNVVGITETLTRKIRQVVKG